MIHPFTIRTIRAIPYHSDRRKVRIVCTESLISLVETQSLQLVIDTLAIKTRHLVGKSKIQKFIVMPFPLPVISYCFVEEIVAVATIDEERRGQMKAFLKICRQSSWSTRVFKFIHFTNQEPLHVGNDSMTRESSGTPSFSCWLFLQLIMEVEIPT